MRAYSLDAARKSASIAVLPCRTPRVRIMARSPSAAPRLHGPDAPLGPQAAAADPCHASRSAASDGLDQQSYVTQRFPRLRLLIPMIVAVAFLMEMLDSTIITT